MMRKAIKAMKVFYYSNYIAKNAVIPAGILESSHRESVARVLKPCYEKLSLIIIELPSLALDSGIHARMTGFKTVASKNEYFAWNN
jgi:hypothetical protein